MRWNIDELTLRVAEPIATVRSDEAGTMTVQYAQCAAGVDLAPLLEGLPGDMCSCPHWGYVLDGAIVARYGSGTEETIGAGELYYIPAGHTMRFETATRYLDMSPTEQANIVSAHMDWKMAAMTST